MLEKCTFLGSRVSSSSWHAAELAALLFAEYMASPRFHGDILDTITTVCVTVFTQNRRLPRKIWSSCRYLLVQRVLYRTIECGVAALCATGPVFCRDALVLFYAMPLAQEYRLSSCWLTRVLSLLTRVFYPGVLQRVVNCFDLPFMYDSTSYRSAALSGSCSNGISGSNHPSSATSQAYAGAKETRSGFSFSKPAPATATGGSSSSSNISSSTADEFGHVPPVYRDSTRFYRYSYDVHTAYAVLAAGFIPDVTRSIMEHIEWAMLFAQERGKATSSWRLPKQYLAVMSGQCVRNALVYGARIAGAYVGRAASREATGSTIFWCEHVSLAVSLIPISLLSQFTMLWVNNALERVRPATAEDEMEDRREQEEAQQQQPYDHAEGGTGGDDGGIPASELSPNHRNVNYYEVLGVDDDAPQAEIKKSYRRLALQYHPDRVAKDSAAQQENNAKMTLINEAYHTLIDNDRRARYDSLRHLPDLSKVVNYVRGMALVPTVAAATGLVASLYMMTGILIHTQYTALFRQFTSPGLGPFNFAM